MLNRFYKFYFCLRYFIIFIFIKSKRAITNIINISTYDGRNKISNSILRFFLIKLLLNCRCKKLAKKFDTGTITRLIIEKNKTNNFYIFNVSLFDFVDRHYNIMCTNNNEDTNNNNEIIKCELINNKNNKDVTEIMINYYNGNYDNTIFNICLFNKINVFTYEKFKCKYINDNGNIEIIEFDINRNFVERKFNKLIYSNLFGILNHFNGINII